MKITACIQLLALSAVLVTGVSRAQSTGPTPGSCDRSIAKAVLDVNNVQADLFMSGISLYEVPVGSALYALSTSAIWFGGYVEGDLRVVGDRWHANEFRPGPLLPGGSLPDPLDCSRYDRMYEITVEDIALFETQRIVTPNLSEWPWEVGAPVVDGDDNPDNYDFYAGDRPELLGDQRLWWVMNDVGNEHIESRSNPLGVEVHGTATARSLWHDAIENTTIYSYRVINRLSVPIDSMFMGVYAQTDLGYRNDVFIGVDTSLAMSFSYISEDVDHDFYGGAPPALGMVLVKGWPSSNDGMDNDYDGRTDETGEEAGLSHFMWWAGDEDIHRAQEKYNMMTGYYRYGEPMTYGDRGWGGTTKTRFQWPGDPVAGTGWTAFSVDSWGSGTPGGRPGSVTSFGPFRLGPGEFAEFTFAYVWAQGESNLDSITKLRANASALKTVFGDIFGPRAPNYSPPPDHQEPVSLENGMSRLHPNPAGDDVLVSYSVGDAAVVRIELFDTLGRTVKVFIDAFKSIGWHSERFSVRDLASGVYVYRASIGRETATGTLVVQH